MKHLLILVVIVLGLGLAGCTPSSPSPDQPAATETTTGASIPAVHMVAALDGELHLKREGYAVDDTAFIGTPLYFGDLLTLEPTAQAKVVCADLRIVSVKPGKSGVPCPPEQPLLTYKGQPISSLRGTPDDDFPRLLSPRNTMLLDPHPTIRWQPVTGVTSYTVTLQPGEWSTTVATTETVYPDDAPTLEYGKNYRFVITANGHTSDEEGDGLGFAMVSEAQAKEIQAQAQRIQELQTTDTAHQIILARLYASHGLYAEAIEVLRTVSATVQTPAVALLLADLYQDVDLIAQAEEAYQQAITLAKQANAIEIQAQAHEQLGRIAQLKKEAETARDHLTAAIEHYEQLDATEKADELRGILERL